MHRLLSSVGASKAMVEYFSVAVRAVLHSVKDLIDALLDPSRHAHVNGLTGMVSDIRHDNDILDRRIDMHSCGMSLPRMCSQWLLLFDALNLRRKDFLSFDPISTVIYRWR